MKGVSIEEATRCVVHAFKARKCDVTQSATEDVHKFSGLHCTSTFTQGCGLIALVRNGGNIGVKIGLKTSVTISGTLLGFFSLLISIPLIGLPILLFFLLYDQAAGRLTHELDRLIVEIQEQVAQRSKNG